MWIVRRRTGIEPLAASEPQKIEHPMSRYQVEEPRVGDPGDRSM